MIPEAGQKFGPYEILGRLGGGGMGLVLRAWDERLHRAVAIKLLHNDYSMPSMRERFLQEARAASALNHPHICTIFDIGEQNGVPYLVMELLEGETVKDRIIRGALSVEEILRYGQEIAEALAAAHAKGIVHRDIKPANIFLVTMPDGRSQAKVLDFGLAQIGLQALGGWESRTLDLTLAGATVGTLAYMSPEQARGETLDARSDLFSLGIVLYEMATRQIPFKGTTSSVLYTELLNQVPEPVRTWNESVPRELERVILKLMAKDKRERFQTANELYDSLGKIAEKTSRGRWLTRGPASAAVPLVRASDPVARHKGPKRKPVETPGSVAGKPSTPTQQVVSDSSADNVMIRPVRMPTPERDAAVVQPGSAQDIQSIQAQSSIAAKPSKSGMDVAQESMPALSRSGATQFEYGLDELMPQPTAAESALHRKIAETPTKPANAGRSAAIALVLALLFVGGIIFMVVHDGFLRPSALGPKDRLLLTQITNKTGDSTLDNTVMQGIEIALRQSAFLNVLGGEAYRAGLRQVGDDATLVLNQKVAQRVGAKAYLTGEITGSEGSPYTISVSVIKTDTNSRVTSLEENASDRAQIPQTIGRLVQRLRTKIGDSGAKHNVPLEQEATGNLNALHAYATGESGMQDGRISDALAAYQQAAKQDPKFVQAQMRLAWLYRMEQAETAAADAAQRARTAAEGSSDKVKLLAQFCYEMNSTGDYGRATETIRQYVAKYPTDVEGMKGLAQVLRLQGYLPEALLAAQQGYGENPFDAEIYKEAELAMIGLDRRDGVLQLQAQERRRGIPADSVNVSDTVKSADSSTSEAFYLAPQMSYAKLNRHGLVLDNAGRMSEGLVFWRAAAAKAAQTPELVSAQAYMLAQGALDRALIDSCSIALEMVNEVRSLPMGPMAASNAAIAAALCGDKTYGDKAIAEMQRRFPQNTLVTQYYLPESEAAVALGVNEPARALQILSNTRVREQVSLIPYLRGLAHARTGQMSSAVLDFQGVLAHKGLALMSEGTIYPMSELGVARAYAATGDKADSVAAYRSFLDLWSEADKGQSGITEASIKCR